ncbi:MAG TPA: circularly permuted type 2 ATP-grasp protein, partial [Lacipirellulaceae bacterium]|nr:circularly permuted type 2 ATP-grasp protein [Lacipirellulaceae bacterium]
NPASVRRWEQAQRRLRQNSLAYPDLGNPTARRHPWELDGFPLVIGAQEWAGVAAALQQRARLLDLVLVDLFGPQRLVRDGLLPPEVLYRHPGFRLPYCRGPIPWSARGNEPDAAAYGDAGPKMLQFYAADLARGSDGRWGVLADRCESASGAGFALENRLALSQMLPDVVRHCRVERLAAYFIAVKEQLARLAPPYEGEPRVVLLSQEAGSINYFEDAFLARYLGYTLAEAGDLAVRRNQVFLKSLAGLSPVHVLLRRPNSEHCDPLEVVDGGSLGVAGLFQAARSGNVALANSPGSGLVESPVFLAFLPALCQALLGEPLQMPNVATWWCGDPAALAEVLPRLDELNVAPAFRRRGQLPAETSRLAELDRDELAALVLRDPGAYVAQERMVRSTAPVLAGDQVSPSYIALRTFAVAQQERYVVMPGGLARVSPTLGPLELSLLDGERSKDCWVLADGPVAQISLLTAPDEEVELRRGGVDLSSRAAENFFWMGRHAVRAESLAKLLRSAARRLAGEEALERIPELPHLLRALAEQGQIEPGYVVDEIRPQLPSIERQLPRSAF